MAKIEKFEDIEAWQEARSLVKATYAVTGTGAFSRQRVKVQCSRFKV